MRDIDLLADLFEYLTKGIQNEVEGLSDAELRWQPDTQANPIGVTVWHVGRWLDVTLVQLLRAGSPEEEQWQTGGWTAATGYDPRGLGWLGAGALSGYTWAEVEAVPALSATELVLYLDQTSAALCAHLRASPSEALTQPIPKFDGTRTAYQWLKLLLKDAFGHLGEIQALKNMQKRLASTSE